MPISPTHPAVAPGLGCVKLPPAEPIVRHVSRHAMARARERWRDLAELSDADLADALRDRAERARYYGVVNQLLAYAHADMIFVWLGMTRWSPC